MELWRTPGHLKIPITPWRISRHQASKWSRNVFLRGFLHSYLSWGEIADRQGRNIFGRAVILVVLRLCVYAGRARGYYVLKVYSIFGRAQISYSLSDIEDFSFVDRLVGVPILLHACGPDLVARTRSRRAL